MKTIDLNIRSYASGKSELKKWDIEIIKTLISNVLKRSINGVILDEEGREKVTKAVTIDIICYYARVINALIIHQNGIIQLEDADYMFLSDQWNTAVVTCEEESALLIYAITTAIEAAYHNKGNAE